MSRNHRFKKGSSPLYGKQKATGRVKPAYEHHKSLSSSVEYQPIPGGRDHNRGWRDQDSIGKHDPSGRLSTLSANQYQHSQYLSPLPHRSRLGGVAGHPASEGETVFLSEPRVSKKNLCRTVSGFRGALCPPNRSGARKAAAKEDRILQVIALFIRERRPAETRPPHRGCE